MKPTIGLKILLFFARHPDEELTVDDMTIKFSSSYEQVRKSLKPLTRDGWVVKRRQSSPRSRNGYFNIYSAGPTLG